MLAPLPTIRAIVEPLPLVVDLDGTLIRSDLLIETFFATIGRDLASLLGVARAAWVGKAAIKHYLRDATLDVARLPYDETVLSEIVLAREAGRRVVLASASNEILVEKVARHLGLFDGWFGSSAQHNLHGSAKAKHLVDLFGERGFDYIGNHASDLAIWAHANRAFAIRLAPAAQRRLLAMAPNAVFLDGIPISIPGESRLKGELRAWAKLIRVHQYAKNALVFVPLLMAHRFDFSLFASAVLAFVAFSLCASSVYLLNDLVDIEADRAHPSKRHRALASGRIAPLSAMVVAPLLFAASLIISVAVSWNFAAMLLAYFALTIAYSFSLKRKMLVDVVTLAALYTVRVVAGGVAVGVVVSNWLLAFSLFLFMSLALIKRYTELASRLDGGLPSPSNRNYELSDLSVVAAMAAGSGYNAVVVLALYLSSDAVTQLYRRPELLWFVCPVILYWISRALLLAHRRMMHDDPIVFALRDRVSLITAATVGILALAAI